MSAVRLLAIARGSVFQSGGNIHPPSSVSLSQMTPTPVCQRTSAVHSLRCLNVLTQREASRWRTSCASSPSAWTVWACSVIPTWCCRTRLWRIRSAVTDSEHKERHRFQEREHTHKTWICRVSSVQIWICMQTISIGPLCMHPLPLRFVKCERHEHHVHGHAHTLL